VGRWNLEGSEHGKEHWFCMFMAFLEYVIKLLPKNTVPWSHTEVQKEFPWIDSLFIHLPVAVYSILYFSSH
jgi:hypothetical protein